ncbi:twin-arginine translocase TatA/TatE family subunit [Microbacterium betulae]|uniref:Sec-independent protein translocase protein TatA n=1 Tax=Microbacterium betulae TaxID=2981139 RepID=A0AA97I6S1_9MICO|nr:twin-arginine translocase TatA/TatE family subunit [Microbacterium sp. AB]WOF22922.1 twin-arginine translocase TatA/TatE family subunit [Microbacterium sp. AB]
MLQNLTGWHAIVILAVVVLVFGAAKLPALAKSVGQSVRILKKEVAEPGAHEPAADERRADGRAAGEEAPAPVALAADAPSPPHPPLPERAAS